MKVDRVVDLVVAEQWSVLVEDLRDWHTHTFPLWNRDIRETAIGSWCCRQVVRTLQAKTAIGLGTFTAARHRTELVAEVQTFRDSEAMQYAGFLLRIERHPSAESMIAKTLEWIRSV